MHDEPINHSVSEAAAAASPQSVDSLPPGFPLDATSARIVGSLIEKAMTTPDNYPLSLNAVTTACNQVSNRDPVVDFSEDLVERTLRTLADAGIASLYHKPGDRVVKYVHKLERALEVDERALALLAVLLLRGDQTPGELRQRTQRYGTFDSLAEVDSALDALMDVQPPLVRRLDRQPGQKEQRYRELISDRGESAAVAPPDTAPADTAPADADPAPRVPTNAADPVHDLETRVSVLEQRLEALLGQLGVDDL